MTGLQLEMCDDLRNALDDQLRLLRARRTDDQQAVRLHERSAWIRGAFWDLPASEIWISDPYGDRLWQMELNSLRWVDVLRRNEPTHSRDKHLWEEIVADWCAAEKSGKVPESAWGLIPALQRAEVIARGLAANMPSATNVETLHGALENHLQYFSNRIKAGRGAYLEEILSVHALCSFVLPNPQKRISEFLRLALNTFVDEKGLPQGASPGHAVRAAEMWLNTVVKFRSCFEEYSAWEQRLTGARDLLVHATRPDGYLAGVDGQNEWDVFPPGTRTESYALTAGAEGDPPPELDFIASSGWIFSRSGWGETERAAEDETFFSVRYGDARTEGRRPDNGALTFFTNGEQWLTDINSHLAFKDGNADKRYLHNTIEIDNYRYRPHGKSEIVRIRRAMRSREYVLNDLAYRPVQFRRRVIYSESGDYLLVIDQLRSTEAHVGTQNWVVPPDAEVEVTGSGVVIHQNGKQIAIEWLNQPIEVRVEPIRQTAREDALLGKRIFVRINARSTRLIVLISEVSKKNPLDVSRVPMDGGSVAVLVTKGAHREQLVVTPEGAGVGSFESPADEIAEAIRNGALHGGRDANASQDLELKAIAAIETAKNVVRSSDGTISSRRQGIENLLAFIEQHEIVGYRDYGLGAALIDLAGSEYKDLVNRCGLVSQQKRTPVVNWSNDVAVHHEYYGVPLVTGTKVPTHFETTPSRYIWTTDFGQLVLPSYLNFESSGSILSVMFHGATDRVRNTMPRFERMRSMETLKRGPLAFFSDPCLDLDANMILSWYAGRENLNLHAKIAETIVGISRSTGASKVLLVGNSGGAFTALQVSSYLPESAVVAFNPQVTIDRYAPRIAEEAHQNLFGRSSVSDDPNLASRMDVIQRFEEIDFDRRVYLIQNTGDDHHFQEHFLPLKFAFENSNNAGNLRVYTPDLGPGHRVPPPDEYMQEVRKGMEMFLGR